ncbi:MAG TPA: phosphoribosyltransferase family protein, partial [Tissierellaceae bacterium]|nr:phosphoribosyltransferase family protein [Tissierellaceae bacterium]
MEVDKRERILFSREEISERVKDLGQDISKAFQKKDLVVVSLLRGSFIFAADLIREVSIPVEVDFITTSSYGHSESSSGQVDIVHDLRTTIEGRDVLIVDDIMDSGYTMK